MVLMLSLLFAKGVPKKEDSLNYYFNWLHYDFTGSSLLGRKIFSHQRIIFLERNNFDLWENHGEQPPTAGEGACSTI
jgi:hypothetical protein